MKYVLTGILDESKILYKSVSSETSFVEGWCFIHDFLIYDPLLFSSKVDAYSIIEGLNSLSSINPIIKRYKYSVITEDEFFILSTMST